MLIRSSRTYKNIYLLSLVFLYIQLNFSPFPQRHQKQVGWPPLFGEGFFPFIIRHKTLTLLSFGVQEFQGIERQITKKVLLILKCYHVFLMACV